MLVIFLRTGSRNRAAGKENVEIISSRQFLDIYDLEFLYMKYAAKT